MNYLKFRLDMHEGFDEVLSHIERCYFAENSLDTCYRKLDEAVKNLLANRGDAKEVFGCMLATVNLIRKLAECEQFDLNDAVRLGISINEGTRKYLKGDK